MAVTITDIRRGACTCQHYRITIDNDGRKETAVVYVDDVAKAEAWPDKSPIGSGGS